MSKRALIHRSVLVMLGLAVVTAIAVPLYAHCGNCAVDGKAQAAAFDKNKMTLAAAATLAEVKTKGTAVRAMVHQHDAGPVVEVHCMVEGKVIAVEVDATNGKILKSAEVKNLTAHAS